MKVYNVTLEQLQEASALTPCKLQNVQQTPRYIQFVIRPTEETPEYLRKTGYHGRRVAALTYDGHKGFMDNLFSINPKTKLTSTGYNLTYNKRATIVYDGIDSYKAQVN